MYGAFNTMHHASVYWRNESKEGRQPRASIVNTVSSAGLQGQASQINYGGAKAAVAAMTIIASLELKRYGVRAVMGKGGMGAKTLAAMKDFGAVYLNAIGGAAQYYAKCIDEVLDVNLLEFGIPEAMWHLRVTDFPAIVTMDAHGNSLHADVEKASALILEKLAEPVF